MNTIFRWEPFGVSRNSVMLRTATPRLDRDNFERLFGLGFGYDAGLRMMLSKEDERKLIRLAEQNPYGIWSQLCNAVRAAGKIRVWIEEENKEVTPTI